MLGTKKIDSGLVGRTFGPQRRQWLMTKEEFARVELGSEL